MILAYFGPIRIEEPRHFAALRAIQPVFAAYLVKFESLPEAGSYEHSHRTRRGRWRKRQQERIRHAYLSAIENSLGRLGYIQLVKGDALDFYCVS